MFRIRDTCGCQLWSMTSCIHTVLGANCIRLHAKGHGGFMQSRFGIALYFWALLLLL